MNTLVAQLQALRGAGVRIALDDFGSGYSSLGQLDRLPVDIIKLDRDLIAKDDGGVGPLAEVAVELGRRLGMDVIAEGWRPTPNWRPWSRPRRRWSRATCWPGRCRPTS
ncbi:hypothetical protein GCM10029992_31300 [Glycomyces albus]